MGVGDNVDERAEYEELWWFASREEQREELADRLHHEDPPPMGTTARDLYDRADAFARGVIAHRALRMALEHEQTCRAEADRLLERARGRLDAAQVANDRADALADVLFGDRA